VHRPTLELVKTARALGGEVSGRQVLAPGPSHSPQDRSLALRERLPNRRQSMTFSFKCNWLASTATASWFYDGHLAELFLNNHKSNSAADIETIREALWRAGVLGAALDQIARAAK
jgi:hypothetical protein